MAGIGGGGGINARWNALTTAVTQQARAAGQTIAAAHATGRQGYNDGKEYLSNGGKWAIDKGVNLLHPYSNYSNVFDVQAAQIGTQRINDAHQAATAAGAAGLRAPRPGEPRGTDPNGNIVVAQRLKKGGAHEAVEAGWKQWGIDSGKWAGHLGMNTLRNVAVVGAPRMAGEVAGYFLAELVNTHPKVAIGLQCVFVAVQVSRAWHGIEKELADLPEIQEDATNNFAGNDNMTVAQQRNARIARKAVAIGFAVASTSADIAALVAMGQAMRGGGAGWEAGAQFFTRMARRNDIYGSGRDVINGWINNAMANEGQLRNMTFAETATSAVVYGIMQWMVGGMTADVAAEAMSAGAGSIGKDFARIAALSVGINVFLEGLDDTVLQYIQAAKAHIAPDFEMKGLNNLWEQTERLTSGALDREGFLNLLAFTAFGLGHVGLDPVKHSAVAGATIAGLISAMYSYYVTGLQEKGGVRSGAARAEARVDNETASGLVTVARNERQQAMQLAEAAVTAGNLATAALTAAAPNPANIRTTRDAADQATQNAETALARANASEQRGQEAIDRASHKAAHKAVTSAQNLRVQLGMPANAAADTAVGHAVGAVVAAASAVGITGQAILDAIHETVTNMVVAPPIVANVVQNAVQQAVTNAGGTAAQATAVADAALEGANAALAGAGTVPNRATIATAVRTALTVPVGTPNANAINDMATRAGTIADTAVHYANTSLTAGTNPLPVPRNPIVPGTADNIGYNPLRQLNQLASGVAVPIGMVVHGVGTVIEKIGDSASDFGTSITDRGRSGLNDADRIGNRV